MSHNDKDSQIQTHLSTENSKKSKSNNSIKRIQMKNGKRKFFYK